MVFFVSRTAIANYVYVDDVADALFKCATAYQAQGVFNLSDDRPLSGFIGAIANALNITPPTLRFPESAARFFAGAFSAVPGFPLTRSRIDALAREVAYPDARIRQRLGFSYSVSIEEGLQRYVESLGD